MNKISILSRSGLAALGALAMAPAHAAWTLNMNEGVTDLTKEVFGLHMLIFWICVVIGIGVFGVMLYSVIVHRKSRGFEAAHFHESTGVEIAWTIIPFLILIAVAIPTAGTLLKVEDSSNPDMTIRVTGHQWLWEYDYVDQGVHFFSRLDRASDKARQQNSGIDPNSVEHYLRNVDNAMVVPVDKKVRLLLTSGDVIHSWWVPDLGGKKDAIPGYINDMWFKANETGTYRGQCAELCGRGHAFMPIVVKVVSQSDYDRWVTDQGGNAGGDSELATGQPSTDDANADAQTSADSSPTAGDATKGRTEDGNTEDPQAAKDSIVGVGEKDNQGASSEQSGEQQREIDSAQASPDRGSPKVDSPETNAEGNQSSDSQQGEGAGGEQGNAQQGSSSNADQGQDGDESDLSKDDLMAQGKQVYGNMCVACHQADGSGMPAAGFPALKGGAITTGPVPAHIAQVLNGKGAMPPYKGSLSDEQIAAVVTYERNALGNSTGDVVQPSQVAEQR
ncbi:cytochrome c oxidase subunit II [Salinisphaera sp. T31B1]|uniref:cytochrome c oxidase subunit II n=1 Tax=Salinisphaera sp. T31B1 TaxID=727963 RepID=UPI00333EF221